MIKTVNAIRYVTPLREGGSMPAIVEADDGQMYVMKFVGAGQGRKALIAELVAGEIGRALGLSVPELALIELDPELGPSEPDPEIFDLLRASVGLNFGMRFLPKAFAYNPPHEPPLDPNIASAIVWFDAYVTNVDRTPRNVNILLWQNALWLIDHGAALYFHHDWKPDYIERSKTAFPLIKDHALLRFASKIDQADVKAHTRLTDTVIDQIVGDIPDAWLEAHSLFASRNEQRKAYATYLKSRLEAADKFVQEAQNARTRLV
jgi:hypothetical protein